MASQREINFVEDIHTMLKWCYWFMFSVMFGMCVSNPKNLGESYYLIAVSIIAGLYYTCGFWLIKQRQKQ